MKQIILETGPVAPPADEPCVNGTIARWAVYGLAMAVLWQLLGPTPAAHALTWGIALLVGLKLLRQM
jgi:hypothetical protein